ncbi:MAG: hypothetical protein KY452_01305 [Actinobacteria bacterium]|nr:hypothetical protein [Actinomycetota bacterium]
MIDPAPGGGRPRDDFFLAPLPVADEVPEPAPEDPPPGPVGATTVEPARARARGAAPLAGAVALVAAVLLLGDRDEGGNGEREAMATTTTARRPATTTTTPLGERPATGPLLPEPTGAALVVVTSSQVLVVELDTGAVRSVAVAGRENYHGAWAADDAVFVLGPEGPFAVPVAPGKDPVVLPEGRASDWVTPSDRAGHAWLIAHVVGDRVEGREVDAGGQETGRQFVLPALLSSAMVAVDGGLVIEALGSLTFYDPDTGEARPIGHGFPLAGSGHTLARLSCEALRCGLHLTDVRTGGDVEVPPAAETTFAPFSPAAFSPDGRWLAAAVGMVTGGRDRVALVDVAEGEVVAFHPFVIGHGTPFAFSPDSRWLFLLDADDVVAHRLGTEETLTLEGLHPGGAVALAVVAIGE